MREGRGHTRDIEIERGGVEVNNDGGKVDDDGFEEEDDGGVLWVMDEAAECFEARVKAVACFEVREEVAACSRAEIEDGRRWHLGR
jgi:hypothetical protein